MIQESVTAVIDISRYSNVMKLYRVTAWVKRFTLNARLKKEERETSNELTVEEINEAEYIWLKEHQKEFKEAKHEQTLRNLGAKEEKGLLRFYGRLEYSELSDEAKHPILLPKDSKLTQLIIQRAHARQMHGGVCETLSEIRMRFWIPKGRQTVKKMIKDCRICKRFSSKLMKSQKVGQLPEFRVKKSKPFQTTGIDFAGPLYTKDGKGMKKSYIVLFACAVFALFT